MRKTPTVLVALLGLASPVLAEGGTWAARGAELAEAAPAGAVVVACYRGPLRDVIWDRPEIAFTDSLRRAGYDMAQAQAIAERVCRDPALVDDRAGLAALTQELMAQTPRARG